MSKKLKENQIIAAKLISFGFSSKYVARQIGIREETLSRWKQNHLFLEKKSKKQLEYLENLETSHFQIIEQSMLTIQEALSTDELSLKDRVDIGIKYLRYTTKYLLEKFDDAKINKSLNNKDNNYLFK